MGAGASTHAACCLGGHQGDLAGADLAVALALLPEAEKAKLRAVLEPKASALTKVKVIFMGIDKDGSGSVVRTELETAMSTIGEDVEKLLGVKQTIKLMIDLGVVDKDGDNKISWAEQAAVRCGRVARHLRRDRQG
jgi:hypothetical protein